MPSKKKKYNARFPPARIKKIMQMDEEVGKVAATVPVIISRALELFIESLIQQAVQTPLSKNAKTLSALHLKRTIESQARYRFLRELVANVPDQQVDEDGIGGNHNDWEESGTIKKRRGSSAGRRPRKKTTDDSMVVQKKEQRKRKKRESSASSESDHSEETDEADEVTDEESVSAPPIFVPSNSEASTSAAAASSSASATTNPPSPGEEQQQRIQEGPASMSTDPTFRTPSMIPASMGMYQAMPPHSTISGMMTAGFPGLGGHPGIGLPGLMMPGTAFPPVSTPFMAPGFPGFSVAGVGCSGLPSKEPAMAGALRGSQGDDDYDT